LLGADLYFSIHRPFPYLALLQLDRLSSHHEPSVGLPKFEQ